MKSRYSKVDICRIIAKGLKVRGYEIHWLSFYSMPQDEMKIFVDFILSLNKPEFKFDKTLLNNWKRQITKMGTFVLVRTD